MSIVTESVKAEYRATFERMTDQGNGVELISAFDQGSAYLLGRDEQALADGRDLKRWKTQSDFPYMYAVARMAPTLMSRISLSEAWQSFETYGAVLTSEEQADQPEVHNDCASWQESSGSTFNCYVHDVYGAEWLIS